MSHILHVVFPVNLYEHNPYLNNGRKHVLVIEEKINFTYLKYHKLKLVLHRSTMKKYFDFLLRRHDTVSLRYAEFDAEEDSLIRSYKDKITCIEFVDPTDHLIVDKWKKLAKRHGLNLLIRPTLNFLMSKEDVHEYRKSNPTPKYYHDRNFYPYMRKKLGVLIDREGKPRGERWSFDTDNRKAFSHKLFKNHESVSFKVNRSKYVKEAIMYVEKNFGDNYGKTTDFIYPISHNEAKKWLKEFVESRLRKFGDYQDIVSKGDPFLYHSVLSASLNIGLLTDRQVLDEILSYKGKVPLNSLEGFVRQLIGWKQFVYFIYESHGEKIRRSNFLNLSGVVGSAFWKGTTGIPPIDGIIRQVDRYAYAHHIQRLMFLGNFMLLCGYHPKSVSDWFQAFVSIDAYDVFMVPNVYEMVCFSAGGIMMTRPYFSSSNYIVRMSDFRASDGSVAVEGKTYAWTEIWDALYYRFVFTHRRVLKSNYSTARAVANVKKKSRREMMRLVDLADSYCVTLD